MNSLAQKIGVGIATLVLLFLIVGTFLPAKRHLERSITIYAPAALIFAEVNSYQQFNNWSPWANIDPNATIKYEGPAAGVGNTMIWASDHPELGNGRQTIVVSEPNKCIVSALQFNDFQGEVTASWKFEEKKAAETYVTWGNDMHNKGGIFAKYLDIIIQPQIGKSYEQGLKNLKAYAEDLYAKQQAVGGKG